MQIVVKIQTDPGAAFLQNSWGAGLLVKEETKSLTFCFRNDDGNSINTITHTEKQSYNFYHFCVLAYNRVKIQKFFLQSMLVVWTFVTHKIRIYYSCLHRAYQSSILSDHIRLKCQLINISKLAHLKQDQTGCKVWIYSTNRRIFLFLPLWIWSWERWQRSVVKFLLVGSASLQWYAFTVKGPTWKGFYDLLEESPHFIPRAGTSKIYIAAAEVPKRTHLPTIQTRLMTSADLLVGASALTPGAPYYLSPHRQ